MKNGLDERMSMAGLAHRRYPDMPLLLALECFRSDRCRAGLGALDERRRKWGGAVSNRKRMEGNNHRVLYDIRINREPRQEYPKLAPAPLGPLQTFPMQTFITLKNIPGRRVHKCLPVEIDMFRTQTGRKFVAQMLWELRRGRNES